MTKYYYLGESNQVSKEVRPDGTEVSFTYNNDGSPLTLSYNGQTYYYVFNGHGDVVALTDANGTKVASYRYDPWGRELKADDKTEADLTDTSTDSSNIGELNPYRYAGYIYDSKQHLYFLKTRYYEPQLGRFLSRDKYKGDDMEITPAAQNKYVYVNNNPVNLTDPSGQKAVGKSSRKPSKPKAKSPKRPKPKSTPKAKHDNEKASTKKTPKKAAVKKKVPNKKVPKKKVPKKKSVKKKVAKTKTSKKKMSNKKPSKKEKTVKKITLKQKKDDNKKGRYNNNRVRGASYNQRTDKNKTWDQRLGSAIENTLAKPIAKALDPGKTTAGAFKATGKAVVGAFAAAGSMAVAAEGVASGAITAGVTKVGQLVNTGVAKATLTLGPRGLSSAAGATKSVIVKGINDISQGELSPFHEYVRSAAVGAAWGYALKTAPASIDINRSMGKATTGLWWAP